MRNCLLEFERNRFRTSSFPSAFQQNPSIQFESTPLTLTTIPPELLLTILSHLPSSRSLYALSQTSRALAVFLNTHASIICNSFIQRDYALASEVLKSEYVDRWLVPRHPCILEAEDKYTRNSSLRAPSIGSEEDSKGGKRSLESNTCCFRVNSFRSDEIHPARFRPPPATQRGSAAHHQDLSLSLILRLPIKLSRPGPQYLCFLERYSTEIITRSQMSRSREDQTRNTAGDDTDPETQTMDDQESQYFSFMVGNYCVKNWLDICARAFSDYSRAIDDSAPRTSSNGPRKWRSQTCNTVTSIWRRTVASAKEKMKPQKSPTFTMLFGEIESEDEKCGASIQTDDWMRGLLWYYSFGSQLDPMQSSCDSKNHSKPKLCGIRDGIAFARTQMKEKGRRFTPALRKVWTARKFKKGFEILD